MRVLATGNDELVNGWTLDRFGVRNFNSDMALAIFDQKQIVGSVFFHAFNGFDIEISYFGPGTMTRGLWKQICAVALDHFGVSRITARTPVTNKQMKRGILKLGFVYEGIRRNAYGKTDAVMYGLYGHNLARLAGRAMQ
jgi:RimJ/RimL family protein N-acetyltransferase